MISEIIWSLALLNLYDEITFFIFGRKAKLNFRLNKHMKPFYRAGGKKGVLMIHGFSSSPGEFVQLANRLAKKNITVYAPLLPGHGTSPKRLAISKWYDWLDSVRNGIELLSKNCNEIWLVGNSLGGNMALIMEGYDPKIKGIVCLGSPILFRRKYKFVRLIMPVMRRVKFMQSKKRHHRQILKRNKMKFSYKQIPLRAFFQVLRIMKLSRIKLQSISKPLLIMQSRSDKLISDENARFIFNESKSKNKKLVWIENSYHDLIADSKRDIVYKEVEKFISS